MKRENLLTQEAADYLRVSARTMENWRFRRIGPKYRKVLGRVIYAREEVECFAASGEVETQR